MPEARVVALRDGRVAIRAPYSRAAVAALKQVPTARWNPELKCWHYAPAPGVLIELRESLARLGLRPVGDVELLAVVAPAVADTSRSLERHVDPPPWPHQVVAAHRIGQERAFYFHGSMGTGKSRGCIDAINNYPLDAVLVLCPSSVVRVWEIQAQRYLARPARVAALSPALGSLKRRTHEAELALGVARAKHEAAIVVINYEAAWRTPFDAWALAQRWNLVVMDECQRIKGARGKQSLFCERLRDHADHIVALSGTPMPHGPGDIFAQFRALDPSIFGDSATRFRSRYEVTHFSLAPNASASNAALAVLGETWHEAKTDGFGTDLGLARRLHRKGMDMQMIIDALVAHRRIVRRHPPQSIGYYMGILRTLTAGITGLARWKNLDELRRKMDSITLHVGREVLCLPPAVETTRHFELDPEERRVHDELKETLRVEIGAGTVTVANALSRLLRLQQATGGWMHTDDDQWRRIGEGRRKLLESILEELAQDVDAAEPFLPCVVFCRFHADLDEVGRASEAVVGQRALELSGRCNELEEWQQPGAPPVLAVQIQAGGLGVDLTRAACSIYYSVGYSLGDYEQAKARTHRPGQTRTVTHVHIIADNTVDEHIYRALQEKADVVDFVLQKLVP